MKLVKYTLAAAAALVVVAPAFAQAAPNDTLTIVLAKGATLNVIGMGATGDVAYKADGTFSGFDGQHLQDRRQQALRNVRRRWRGQCLR